MRDKVYPLTDQRVMQHAVDDWGESSAGYLAVTHTHYNIKHGYFCSNKEPNWNVLFEESLYDDYLKEITE